MLVDTLRELALACGATGTAGIAADEIVLSADFRDICKGNACGNYGMCYMCPPDVGEIDELMNRIRGYRSAVMYQAVYALEDSFDFEGMQAAGAAFNGVSRRIAEKVTEIMRQPWLHLAAGGCRNCEVCAKRENLPCREPDRALASLEAYGVDVYATSSRAGLKYINGKDTVTYFGMLLF